MLQKGLCAAVAIIKTFLFIITTYMCEDSIIKVLHILNRLFKIFPKALYVTAAPTKIPEISKVLSTYFNYINWPSVTLQQPTQANHIDWYISRTAIKKLCVNHSEAAHIVWHKRITLRRFPVELRELKFSRIPSAARSRRLSFP